jgi:hypothetical protein
MEGQTPDQLAINFLSNFIEGEPDEIGSMLITHALSELICALVQETVTILHEEQRTIH